MTKAETTRRFVAQLPSSQLHGLALKLMGDARQEDLSGPQEWLWGLCIDQLEQRWLKASPGDRCSCELCWSPFADPPFPGEPF